MFLFDLFKKKKQSKSSDSKRSVESGFLKHNKRSFESGLIDRLSQDFLGVSLDPNESLEATLTQSKRRTRQLYYNGDYCRHYVKLMVKNVIGQKGITLVLNNEFKNNKESRKVNERILREFKTFCKKQYFSSDKKLSFLKAQKLFQRCHSIDGEVLITISRSKPNRQNPFGISFKVLSSNQLDITYQARLTNDNRVQMGIELNQDDVVVAYHLTDKNPDTNHILSPRKQDRKRLDAKHVIHAYEIELAGQLRGIPPLVSATKNAHQLQKYYEAELISARVGACKMGLFTSEEGEEYLGDDKGNNNEIIMDASPGTFQKLPRGVHLETFDPKHDSNSFNSFKKAQLMGMGAGVGLSYSTLGNDLESVNYSSIRQGVLEERETYKEAQEFICEEFCKPIFEEWLKWQLSFGVLKDLSNKYTFEELNNTDFKPKGFGWIDPQKEMTAFKVGLENNMITLTDILSARGETLEGHLKKIQRENELFKEYGIERNIEKEKEVVSKNEQKN
ncbi:MAG: phage portal protein [Candidatus Cloacimonadota bacterium]|nr:MAG: phage portal protein [Candidatus Cloacimonadota bacterium]